MTNTTERTVALNYADKLFQNLVLCVNSTNRAFLLAAIFNVIMLTLSLGYVSVSQQYSIFGMTLRTTPWLIFLVGAWVVNALSFYTLHGLKGVMILRKRIIQVYGSIGYKLPQSVELMGGIYTGFLDGFLEEIEKNKNRDILLQIAGFIEFGVLSFLYVGLPIIVIYFCMIDFLVFNKNSNISIAIAILTFIPQFAYILRYFREK